MSQPATLCRWQAEFVSDTERKWIYVTKKEPWYNRIEKTVILILFPIMTFIMFFSVVSRYCFNFTFSWAEQVTRILFVWMTFAGISLAALQSAHMRVSAISIVLGEKRSKAVFYFGNLVAAGFGLMISFYMFNCVMNAVNNKQTFTAVPGLNVGVMYAAGVFGMLGFTVRMIQALVGEIRASKKESEVDKA